MELQQFSHPHPCTKCGVMVWDPSFMMCKACSFFLPMAPAELNHPFHRLHSFHLLAKPAYQGSSCNFCNKMCENSVYHCSCLLDLHVKCALFSYDIAEKRVGYLLQHFARIDPLMSTENRDYEELKTAECFACWKPLLNSPYFFLECGFYLHEKCGDLATKVNHPLHHEHPLFLQFNSEHFSCKMCKKTQLRGFVYCCPPCEFVLDIHCAATPTKLNQHYFHRKHPLTLQFVLESLPCQICQESQISEPVYFCSICKFLLHIGCVSTLPLTEDKIHHEHNFIQLWRQVALVCDACGISGNFVPYVCSICNHMVHKKCISLPRIIRFFYHFHPLLHTYFLEQHGLETSECRFCYEVVKIEHGSYFCSKCNYILHVNCALENPLFYNVVDSKELDEYKDLPWSVDEFIDSRGNVTGTRVKHFSHAHSLALSDDIKNYIQCDGCSLSISTSYYYCSQCDFFLHKSCAKLPMKKHMWDHYHSEGGVLPKLHRLIFDGVFQCLRCKYESSGFSYYCEECWSRYCVQCASMSDIPICLGHEHPVPFHFHYKGKGSCNACGDPLDTAYRCRRCNFALHGNCLRLPVTVRHKSDEHPLKLTYVDNSNYSEYYYCDICETERNPNHWFYSCEICNHAAHTKCVLRKDSFIKLGSLYTKGDHHHPHPLTFVQKVHIYPECKICGKRCFDLALECKEIGCHYIIHWECVKPSNLHDRKYI